MCDSIGRFSSWAPVPHQHPFDCQILSVQGSKHLAYPLHPWHQRTFGPCLSFSRCHRRYPHLGLVLVWDSNCWVLGSCHPASGRPHQASLQRCHLKNWWRPEPWSSPQMPTPCPQSLLRSSGLTLTYLLPFYYLFCVSVSPIFWIIKIKFNFFPT